MSNPMIRSHTGNMVEARVGMVVATDKFSGNFNRAAIIEIHDDKSVSVRISALSIMHRVWANSCTLVYCPFAVGDAIEHKYPILGWKDCGHHIESEEALKMLVMLNAVEPVYRHASPDLRPSPEYKPTRNEE